MHINRHDLEADFSAFARTGSGVVIGAPGVGKTFMLKKFCERRMSENQLCLYLPIDRLGVASETDLRDALNIQTDLVDHLRQQSDAVSEKGVLILDSFDAARSENAQRFFINLIRRSVKKLEDHWTVIVSVRTYDAKKSQELQDIFPRSGRFDVPRKYQLTDVQCRHFAIPELSLEERDEAVRNIVGLKTMYENSSAYFKELLLVPFNLWLVEKIVNLEPDVNEFSTVESDIQLLGLFWKHRVNHGLLADERRTLLSKITRKMVDEHSLSVRTDEVYLLGGAETWRSIMTAEVLVYASSEQRVTFGHNILFDYAVSVLLIEDDANELVEFLSNDPSRPLFLRPSLSFYLTRQWHASPTLFWEIFWRMLPNTDLHIRLFARLLGATVIVNELREVEQLTPLLKALDEKQATATDAVVRVLQANRMLRKAQVVPWAMFLLTVSKCMQKEFAWELSFATNQLLEQAKKYDWEIVSRACGAISRDLLQWLWQERAKPLEPWLENVGSVWIVPLVVKSMSTAPEEAEKLLRGVLALLDEPDFPIDYFFRLANVIEEVWPVSPGFAADFYKAVMAHQEWSGAKTHFGSAVLPMTSNRRQDFDLCKYSLVSKYPNFLQAKPVIAARAAIECVNRFVIDEHLRRYGQPFNLDGAIEHFTFHGEMSSYLADGSYAWDHMHTEEPLKMADSLFGFIEKTAGEGSETELLDELLRELRDHALVAVFWKRLLEIGTRNPKVFAPLLFDLCVSKPVLVGNETLEDVGSFIESASSCFDAGQLLQIETAIMNLPDEGNDEESEGLNYVRDRLIARIPIELLQTPEARARVEKMQQNRSVPANEPLVQTTLSFTPPPVEEFWRNQRGIDPKNPENDTLLKLTAPLEAFASRWQNETPGEDDVESILNQAEQAYEAVSDTSVADEATLETALTRIAGCAATISRAVVDANSRAYRFCREVLLSCAEHPSPLPYPENDANYNHAYWSPAPRIEAGRGLTRLAALREDTEIFLAIERLVGDPKPQVRFLTIIDLFRVMDVSPDFFWRLANERGKTETNKVVAGGLFRTLSYLAMKHEEESVTVLKKFFERVFSGRLDFSVVSDAVPTVVGLAVARSNAWALETIGTFVNEPVRWGEALRSCSFNCVTFLTPQRLEDPDKAQRINNAISLLSRVLEAAAAGVAQVINEVNQGGAWTDVLQYRMKSTYGSIDEAVTRLYFAAKIEGSVSLDQGEEPPSDKQRNLYYFAIKPLLEQIVRFAQRQGNGVLFASTAHYFMQLLNGVLRYDPKGVLGLAAGVAEASEPTGYTFDQLATTEVVKLVESVLADYRYDFRDGQPLMDLMSLLDIFAKTGDAQALALVWRLDEIFR